MLNEPSHIPQAFEWFAVYVIARHEKRIAEHFRVRQIEHYLPLYVTQHKWKDGSNVTLQLPLFPSYLFVRTLRNGRTRVFEAPGVLSIVGKPEASTISDGYIQFLREGLDLHRVEPHPYLVAGRKVRIKGGALAGAEGVLVRRKNGFRVVLTVEVIMRSVAVEVDMADVEPAYSPGPTANDCGQLRAAG